MKPPAVPVNEERRLEVLRRYGVLDTPIESAFDDLAQLAAAICGTPVALISLIDERRQWFKAHVGWSVTEAAREVSFCGHAIHQTDLFVIPDATADERFADNPLVTGDPHVKFYAGAPLIAASGEVLGTLCVMDRIPRLLSASQQDGLRALGRQAMSLLELRRRTAELMESERLLRTMFDSEPECVKMLDRDGKLLMMNRAGLAMIEAEQLDTVRGACLYPLVATDHQEAIRDLTRRVFEGEEGSLQFQLVGLKGTIRWVETHAAPLLDDRGHVTALLGITRDVTERRRAEEALRQSEHNYRILFEQAIDGILVSSHDLRLLDVNPAVCEMTGYSRAQLLTMRVEDLLMPGELVRVEPESARLAGGRVVMSQWQLRHADGSSFTAEITAKRLSDGRHQLFVRDLTDRKVVEDALLETGERLRRAVTAGRVGLWDWDLTTDTVYYSPEWKHQIGYDDNEIRNDLSEWRSRIHPEDLPGCLDAIARLMAGVIPTYEAEFRFRHKNGTHRHIFAQASLIRDEDGRPVAIRGSHVDITERAELQAQFLQAQKLESVGRLAGGIAHDFNNLLTVINGTADLAMSELDDNDVLRADLEQIHMAGTTAANLTRQLLALSRRQILKPDILDLRLVIEGMQSMLQRLIGEDIDLSFALPGRLGNVRADPSQIEQVILNLAVNARDAMPDGGRLTIETTDIWLDDGYVTTHPDVTPGAYVMLRVSDTGIGMDETLQQRIFEPFFTAKGQGKGTGLGLSTVYGIVKQSGGSISVKSAPGLGATFTIYLPRVDEQPGTQAGGTAAVPRGAETVLVVEDERSLRSLCRRILQSAGYTVLEASNGSEALQVLHLHDKPVHLMVTDVVMPGMNGRELAARVAEIRPQVKVLYTSGYTDDAILRHGVLDEPTRFLAKPYTPDGLKRQVRDVLDADR